MLTIELFIPYFSGIVQIINLMEERMYEGKLKDAKIYRGRYLKLEFEWLRSKYDWEETWQDINLSEHFRTNLKLYRKFEKDGVLTLISGATELVIQFHHAQ